MAQCNKNFEHRYKLFPRLSDPLRVRLRPSASSKPHSLPARPPQPQHRASSSRSTTAHPLITPETKPTPKTKKQRSDRGEVKTKTRGAQDATANKEKTTQRRKWGKWKSEARWTPLISITVAGGTDLPYSPPLPVFLAEASGPVSSPVGKKRGSEIRLGKRNGCPLRGRTSFLFRHKVEAAQPGRPTTAQDGTRLSAREHGAAPSFFSLFFLPSSGRLADSD